MPSVGERLRRLLGSAGADPRPQPAELPFTVGDRVADTWGNRALVTEIDVAAEHGLGRIRRRYEDGRELSCSVVAHDLKRVDDTQT